MITLNLPGIFGIAAAALALMLFVKVAVSPPVDRTGKQLLLIFLAGLLAMAVNSLYFALSLHLQWPHVSFTYLLLMAWIGPSLWLYTARVLGLGIEPFGWPAYSHWLPGVVIQLALLPYFPLSGAEKLEFINSDTARWIFAGIYVFIYLQIAVYGLLCQRAMRRHREQIAATEEKEELRTDLGWINVVCYGFAGFVALDGIVPHLRWFWPGVTYAMGMALYLTIILTVFYATSHGRVYPFVGAGNGNDPKYAKSSLRADTARHYLEKLDMLMRTERPYLDSELSLDKLAAALRIHPHYLSQVLNDYVGKNFYDYINERRIAHARTLLVEQPELPVIDVAIACGYNNRNSFYNSFRRFVGVTPSEFRQHGGNAAVPNR